MRRSQLAAAVAAAICAEIALFYGVWLATVAVIDRRQRRITLDLAMEDQ